MRIYAIGDIHGQVDMLRGAHARIAADRAVTSDPDAPVVHLGDLVDRGPDSRGVIDLLIRGLTDGAPWIVLKGNHDRMFLNFLQSGIAHDSGLRRELTWLDPPLGGDRTLASYGVQLRRWTSLRSAWDAAVAAVPQEHLEFLLNLPLMHQTKDLLFVHAGIRPGVPIGDQVEEDLVWIRRPFIEDTRDHGKIVVHGHTPVETPEHYGNRIDIDTGAGFGRALTAAVFEGRDCFILTENGREPLLPYA